MTRALKQSHWDKATLSTNTKEMVFAWITFYLYQWSPPAPIRFLHKNADHNFISEDCLSASITCQWCWEWTSDEQGSYFSIKWWRWSKFFHSRLFFCKLRAFASVTHVRKFHLMCIEMRCKIQSLLAMSFTVPKHWVQFSVTCGVSKTVGACHLTTTIQMKENSVNWMKQIILQTRAPSNLLPAQLITISARTTL